jgi:integrase
MFLYGTGARINETLALKWDDVDLRNDTVNFQRSTLYTRTIPIGMTLGQWLRGYFLLKKNDYEILFARLDGRPISIQTLIRNFESVRRRACVSRKDGTDRKPQLRDLRRTFAVHCLRKWIDQEKDLNRMIPVLSAYLGHAHLSSTEAYLSLAPRRFCKQLTSLKHETVIERIEPPAASGQAGS